MGHELTHGFDDQGRQFDSNGNLSDWWTADDAKKFEQKTDCEVKEYGKFVAVGDAKVNGRLTLGENTVRSADDAGGSLQSVVRGVQRTTFTATLWVTRCPAASSATS